MSEQRRRFLDVLRLTGMAVVLILLLTACSQAPLPVHPGARMILSASDAERVAVQPGGQQVIFWPKGSSSSLMMLDVSTGERVLISQDMHWGGWLDGELLYGYDYPPTSTSRLAYYAINLQPVEVVRLETRITAESLPERIQEADRIYAAEPEVFRGEVKYLLLLLRLDADRKVVGGYAVPDVRDLDTLPAEHPYKIASPRFPDPSPGEKHFSPDGRFYYTCHGPVYGLAIYSQQGTLLNHSTQSPAAGFLVCYGWAWDGSGVFFQEVRAAALTLGDVSSVGPLQLLKVHP